jgi:Flp pilus assembly protein TadG
MRVTFKSFTASQASESGQAMVEFALVVVFVFLVFVSMIQMIMLMYAYNTLADAAKEGVRYAIVHGTGNTNCSGPGTTGVICTDTTGAKVVTAVTNFAGLSFQNIQTSDVTVSYNPNNANGVNPCNVPGCIVSVTVSHTYTPFFGLGWPNFPLNAAASGRIMN